jgi:hypothetical protein
VGVAGAGGCSVGSGSVVKSFPDCFGLRLRCAFMGQRMHYTVVSEGRIELYYSTWRAIRVDLDCGRAGSGFGVCTRAGAARAHARSDLE